MEQLMGDRWDLLSNGVPVAAPQLRKSREFDAPLAPQANEITAGMEFTHTLTDIQIPTGYNTGTGL